MIPSYSQIGRLHRASMETDSWSELEKRVFDRQDPLLDGRRFQSDREFFTLAIAGAHTLLTGKRRHNKACPIDFPATSVEKEDVLYHVHGISHDMTHKRIVRERFSRLENAMIESDLSIYYPSCAVGHPRQHELKYVSLFDIGLMICRVDIWAAEVRDLFSFRPRQKSIDDVFSYRCITMDLKGGSAVSSDVRSTVLPDQKDGSVIGYDISNVLLPDHLEHAWLEYHLSNGFDRACLLRSLAQTEYLTMLAHRMDVTHMHALVGLGHERQIAYFLDHPDRAEEVRLRYEPNTLVSAARRLRSTANILAGAFAVNAVQFVHSMDSWRLDRLLASATVAGVSAFLLSRQYRHMFTNKTYLRASVKSLLAPMR